jgi:hypothetical protein
VGLREVELVAGARGRDKRVHVALSAERVRARLLAELG